MMRTHSFLTVLLWSSVFYVVSTTPSQKRTNKHSHSERITGLSENDGKTLHRTKRGWMWNQFFLLEEYTGPDTQYVGKVSLVFKGSFKGGASNTLDTSLLLHSCFAFCTAVVPISHYVKAHYRPPEVPWLFKGVRETKKFSEKKKKRRKLFRLECSNFLLHMLMQVLFLFHLLNINIRLENRKYRK